jgi:hypothetical protein
MKKFSKKAAIEMSMGTVVVIVLSVTILIFGMIFIKNIMCAGIVMTDKIDEKVSNEIQSLFGTSDYGVKCMGENGQEITIGDGGKRQIICVINTDTQYTYSFNVKRMETLKGIPDSNTQKWILDQDWTGLVSPGQKSVPVLVLEIPRDVSATTLKIEVEEYIRETGAIETHTLYVDVKHVGQIAATIC